MRWRALVVVLAIPALNACEGFMPPTDQLPFAVSQFQPGASGAAPAADADQTLITRAADLMCADDYMLSDSAVYPADRGTFQVVNAQCKPYAPGFGWPSIPGM